MKKILSVILTILGVSALTTGTQAQNYMQISGYMGSTSTSFNVVLKPNFAFNDKLNEVGFTVQVPKSIGAAPAVTVKTNYLSTTFSSWSQVSESSDPTFYNYKFGATALSTAPVIPVASGTELQVVELDIAGGASIMSSVRLAHLADGGPNTQYGVGITDGTLNDLTRYTQMFYGLGVVPASPAADDNAGYSLYQYVLLSNPVPVRFTSFSATKKDNNALLNWQITNETANVQGYEVERSLNGVDFVKINTVAPKNNGLSSNSYNLTDANITSLRNSGVIYYRIKQVDMDGRYVYTEIRSVRLDSKNLAISVYPNPVKDVTNVTIDLLNDADVSIRIVDAGGKEIQTIQMQGIKGLNVKKINLAPYAAGSYMLKVQAGEEVKTIPVVKSN